MCVPSPRAECFTWTMYSIHVGEPYPFQKQLGREFCGPVANVRGAWWGECQLYIASQPYLTDGWRWTLGSHLSDGLLSMHNLYSTSTKIRIRIRKYLFSRNIIEKLWNHVATVKSRAVFAGWPGASGSVPSGRGEGGPEQQWSKYFFYRRRIFPTFQNPVDF